MHKLCNLADIADPGSLRATFPNDPYGHGLCLVRENNVVRAYLNRCPHTQAPMDWVPGRFLNADEDLIQCSLHGARFRLNDGYCVSGPCVGESLQAVHVVCERGQVWLP